MYSLVRYRTYWKIGIPLTLLAVTLGFVLLVWVGLTGFRVVVKSTHDIVGKNLDSVVKISDISTNLHIISTDLYRVLTNTQALEKGKVDIKREMQVIVNQILQLKSDLVEYKEKSSLPDQIVLIDKTLKTLDDYVGVASWLSTMLEVDFASAVSFIDPYNAVLDQMSKDLEEITKSSVKSAKSIAEESAAAASNTVLDFIIVAMFIATVISLVTWFGGRHQLKLQVTAKTLEALVEERTKELAQRSADLEDSLEHLKAAQASLVMQEKMASLGGLVAGVAHEINTPIGVVFSCSTMLFDKTKVFNQAVTDGKLKKSELTEFLHVSMEATGLISSNISQAAELVKTFKTVSADRTSDSRRTFDICAYINSVVVSLSPEYNKNRHKVVLDFDREVEIDSYPGSFAQILSNLIVNSVVHGFDGRTAGTITIKIICLGNIVTLEYSDNGCGIPDEHLNSIFDPFYTTKRGIGNCTGLGMHIVWNIVHKNLGGTVLIDSNVYEGVKFVITFPKNSP